MLFEKFNAENILNGLKICGNFILNQLNYDHVVSGGEGKYLVKIKPKEYSFSLFYKFTHINTVTNGGVSEEVFGEDTCLGIDISSDSEIVNNSHISINEVPVFCIKSLVRSVIPVLIAQFPRFVDGQISSKLEQNKHKIIAKGEKNIYKEEKPKLVKNSDFVVGEMQKLSEKIYQMDLVLSNYITTSSTNNVEIFFDNNGSEIVQYSNNTIITVLLDIVNNNQSFMTISVIEHFKNNIIPENLSDILLERVKNDIKNNLFYHELNSGTYKILLQPNASDVFFHEAFAAHLLSGTYISENISTIFKNRIGESFPTLKGIDIIMDPTIEKGFGSYVYDHQGVKSKKVILLEDGVIKELLNDKKSASKLEIIGKDIEIINQLLEVENIDELLLKHIPEKHLKRAFTKKKDQLIFLLNKHLLEKVIIESGVDTSLDWRSDRNRLKNQSNGHSRVEWWSGTNNSGQTYSISSEARMSNLVIKNNNIDDGMSMEEFAKNSCLKDGQDFYLSVDAFEGEIDVENGTFIINPCLVKKIYVDDREDEVINPGTFSMSLENFLSIIERVGHKNEVSYGHCGARSGFVTVGSYTPQVFVGLTPYQAATELEVVDDAVMDILTNKYT
jgi:predicted Zn-dependent protease